VRKYNRQLLVIWSLTAAIAIWVLLSGRSTTIPAICSLIAVTLTFLLQPRVKKYKFELAGQNEVRSSLGFSVCIDGSSLVYSEGPRTLTIGPESSESGVSKFRINISRVARWDPPNESIEITDKEKAEIRSRIAHALSYRQVMSARRR